MLIIILLIVILIFSAILHEYAHGWMAKRLGDNTAEQAGRLTLNPLKHLDPVGSILLPLVLVIMKAPFFLAWAKPVPYNPNNLRDKKFGDLKVAVAGPLTNFLLAFIFGLAARFIPLAANIKFELISSFLSGNNESLLSLISGSLPASFTLLAMLICFVNLMLGIFNLIPIPPLDGSKVLASILPYAAREKLYQFERYGLIIILLLIMTRAFTFIFYAVLWLFSLLTGL